MPTRLKPERPHRVNAVLLVAIATALLLGHDAAGDRLPPIDGVPLAIAGVVAGFAIGVVATLLGVAGGELLIPTLVLLFGANLQLAGSLWLAVSLPTMIVDFARYSRDRSFAVLGQNRTFVLVMGAGSTLDRRRIP
ncbi:MAG: TSUP family transporter [Geminicoccaceae bacterium]